MMPQLKVAVIGAGAAGLCAVRYLSAKLDVFHPVVYEQTGEIGGTWVYTEETVNKHGLPIHSSMYQNLKTNLPKEVMAFPDFPFRENLPSFVTHSDVKQYLNDYAKHYNLLHHIKFYRYVESISPIKTDVTQKEKWIVRVRSIQDTNSEVETNVFDAVMVCNGHYSTPYTPAISGLDGFKGVLSHSHDYRHPEPYKDKVVAVLGAGSSGVDISLDLAKCAEKVLLCHWNPGVCKRVPENVELKSPVVRIKGDNTIVFNDGEDHHVDAILACTGYRYSFPFLTPECDVTVRDRHILQLYKHLVHTAHPSLSFVGIPFKICPFPQFALQVMYVTRVLDGSISLPSKEEMESEEERHLRALLRTGGAEKEFHSLGNGQWAYNATLSELASLEPVPAVVEDLYNFVAHHRGERIMKYKKMNFEIVDDNSWKQIEDTI